MPTIRKPFFVVPLDLGSIVSGNTKAGFHVDSLNRLKAMGLTWRTDGAGNAWARGFLGRACQIDFCSMIAANALPGTKIRLRLGNSQTAVDGGSANYDSGLMDFISPSLTRDDGLYHSHLEIGAVQTASWWRIDISAHTGDFEAAGLVLGKRIEPSRFYNFDFEYGARDLGDIEFGRFGVVEETPGVVWRELNFTLAWQNEAEFEASFRPMVERLGRRGVVYLCFDPEPSAYRQARTFLGFFDKLPYARGIRKPRTFSQDYQIVSMI